MKGMLRPVATVLPDSALVGQPEVVSPPPNQFTHAVRGRQPFYVGASMSGEPAGTLPAGTKVVLMVRGGRDVCRVIDRRGRYLTVSCKSLRPLA